MIWVMINRRLSDVAQPAVGRFAGQPPLRFGLCDGGMKVPGGPTGGNVDNHDNWIKHVDLP